MKVMIFLDYFTPAYRAGGPIRIFESVARGITQPDEAFIVTQNRDLGETGPLKNVLHDDWTTYEKARVFYASEKRRSPSDIRAFVEKMAPERIHLNSVFSRTWTMKILWMRRLGAFRDQYFFLSPHGELAMAALRHKPWRKRLFLTFAKAIGFYRDVTWIATSNKEVQEIHREIGMDAHVVISPPPFPKVFPHKEYTKKPGELKLVFFARLSEMKNIGYLNRIFPKVKGRIVFDVYGPIDEEYKESWYTILARMRKEIGAGNVVTYKGPIPSEQAAETLAQYDLFIQPSLTENFGYSILEAIASGTPILISDRTPWNNVKTAQIGCVQRLEDIDAFAEKLQSFIDMDDAEWKQWSQRATEWAKSQLQTAKHLFRAYAGAGLSAGSDTGDGQMRRKA